ncbi:ankyrin repeat domain-containing protein [Paenibacillus sp. D9]|uniref:ankyrin repeat domain-containing protein n=1 Tax=Paenibacillus sp. D9 TaxID=665792 RepID=UPI001E35DF28|nr:ankyrin repeat domain-containing protein [Paenibacillus sp. D9]
MKHNDPLVVSFVQAVQTGDLDALRRLLIEVPGLASMRAIDNKGGFRTTLHVVTDWPGYFLNGPVIVKMLIDAGADPNALATGGNFSETQLHWAASSDDVDVAATLINGGANIEVIGGSIAGSTPLDNAVGWYVARLLVQRGARVDKLWHAAALGMLFRVEELMGSNPVPTVDYINEAFWHACNGGQRRVAEYLLSKGADLNGIPGYSDQTPLDAAGNLDTRRDTLVSWLNSKGAKSSKLA